MTLTFCTIISENYADQAKVLVASLQKVYGKVECYVLVVDEQKQMDIPAKILSLDDVWRGRKDITLYYNAHQLTNSLKPSLIKYLMEKEKKEKVIYLDSDIWVQKKLDEVEALLDQHDLCFTPHILSTLPVDGKKPMDVHISFVGLYNGGFWACRKTKKTFEILDWAIDRFVTAFMYADAADQQLLNVLVYLFTDHVHILKDPSYNIAYWNVHERALSYREGKYYVNKKPVTFFHASGFDPAHPEKFSKHSSRFDAQTQPIFAQWLRAYAEKGAKSKRGEYGFARYKGIMLDDVLRRYYFDHKRLPSTLHLFSRAIRRNLRNISKWFKW